MKKENVSFDEFAKTMYYTEKYLVLPLLNIRLEKVLFFTKGKLDKEKITQRVRKIYEETFN